VAVNERSNQTTVHIPWYGHMIGLCMEYTDGLFAIPIALYLQAMLIQAAATVTVT